MFNFYTPWKHHKVNKDPVVSLDAVNLSTFQGN